LGNFLDFGDLPLVGFERGGILVLVRDHCAFLEWISRRLDLEVSIEAFIHQSSLAFRKINLAWAC
jgi:hypothetical protein